MEEQKAAEKTIPVFTVVKNGAILKNIFVVNSRDFSSPERNGNDDDGEVEVILKVGRHPDCDILLTHPSISRLHLEIHSIPSRQKLFLTDLSSVHGTWVADQKVESGACVEVKEGDVIRIGGSTRTYRLHWIPLSRAYDTDNPFVSPLDASTAINQDEEDRMLDSDIAHQSHGETASGDDRDSHLDVTSEGTGSSVPSEDEDTYITTQDISLPLASPSILALATDPVKTDKLQFNEDLQASSKWDLDVEDVAAEIPSSSYSPSKQQSGGYPEVLGYSELEVAADADECDVKEDGALNLDVMSERLESSSISLPRDSSVTEKLRITEDVKASQELAINIIEANSENPVSCCFPSKGQIVGCIEALGCSAFELASDVEIMSLHREVNGGTGTEFVRKQVMEASAEPLTKDVIQSQEDNGKAAVSSQMIAVSPSSFPLTEPNLENITEDSQGLLSSEFQSAVAFETAIENLYQKRNGEIEVVVIQSHEDSEQTEVSRQIIASSPKSFPQSEPTLEKSTGHSQSQLGSEFRSEVALETDGGNLYQKSNGETEAFVIQSHEDTGETEVSRKIITISSNSFPQTEPTLKSVTEDSQGHLSSEFQSEVALETDSENLCQKNASALSDCLFAGNESLSRITAEDIQSLFSSWQPLPESEVRAPSEIWSELNPADNENQKSEMSRETEKIVDDESSSCLSEDLKQSILLTPIQKPTPETSTGTGGSEESFSLSEIENTVEGIPFEDTKRIEELPSEYTGSQENQTPQGYAVRDDVLSEINSSECSSRRLSTCNIWSRRGKDASVLQIRTNSSKGKQKQNGNQPKAQLQRKQAVRDNSTSLTVHHGGENLEPEIFTPDKENLTPRSHMLRRLHNIGDIKDSKSSSKLSRSSCSSLKIPFVIDIITSEALTEPEIFTPDKENLTPNSHMLKRLREVGEIKESKGSSSKATRKPFFDIHLKENVMTEQKPGLHCMSSTSKVKGEALALKNKIERTPFQPLLEKSTDQSQSYTEASSNALARNNVSRGIRSSSNLSDGKSKMKWTIVLDTSSLLDKEARKPLHLLQGLKGTHLVVPRTVLRELNEMKRSRSLLFNRKAEIASSALDWIEECKVNTKWWIQLQNVTEETKATAPTPPVTPQLNGSAAFPFSLEWNNNEPEIESPTSQDQVLECALLYRNINSEEKVVVLSNDASVKIKAMAEGVICETADEFYESLVNPYSERFMWRESSARGRTWSHVDDVVLRERYNNRRGVRGATAKGLKLILLHNSRYGHNH